MLLTGRGQVVFEVFYFLLLNQHHLQRGNKQLTLKLSCQYSNMKKLCMNLLQNHKQIIKFKTYIP